MSAQTSVNGGPDRSRVQKERCEASDIGLGEDRIRRSPTSLADAYATCEEITRREARNFYYGIRLLAPEKRAALSAVYALARRIDDIGDGSMSPTDKRAALQTVRTGLDRLDVAADPVLVAVADVARRMPLPIEAFGELIDGVLLDLAIDTEGYRFATFADLELYCRCVAGSIGRLCLAVFATPEHPATPEGMQLADTLGIGLQQINILRDIREDLTNGRIYLPLADLERHGVELRLDRDGSLAGGDRFEALVRDLAGRARTWYDAGLPLVRQLDRRSTACTLAMAGIYSRLLDRIAEQPALVTDRRLSLSGRGKAVVAVRALLGRTA